MAYDEAVAARFRTAISRQFQTTEKRMMGGLCFMLDGHMVGGADRTKAGEPRFMFRVGKDNDAMPLRRFPEPSPMVQGGRRMKGFFFVNADACDDACLNAWLALATTFVRSLPPK